MIAPEPELAAFLHEAGLADPGDDGVWTPLAGGVSSDIWRVDTAKGSICVKRALTQLRVADEWTVPVDRNAFEWAYMKVADAIAPGQVPKPIAQDEARGLFAMAWLAPEDHKLWKSELLAGHVDPIDAGAVGDLIGRIHSATARDPDIPGRFATDENFHAIRIEPYLLTTAERHPDIADHIRAIAKTTAETRRTLVHGDVSPKNILIGPHGPVLLDAECAWHGDPAFDLAFCLNHLLIKARIMPSVRDALSDAFDALSMHYFDHVDWEEAAALDARIAALLPGLALARVDGKSPVEYLNDVQRIALRATARDTLMAAPPSLAEAKQLLLR